MGHQIASEAGRQELAELMIKKGVDPSLCYHYKLHCHPIQ
jgi:hypothetical protein